MNGSLKANYWEKNFAVNTNLIFYNVKKKPYRNEISKNPLKKQLAFFIELGRIFKL